MNVIASKICNVFNHTKIVFNKDKQLILSCCYQQRSVEFTKQLLSVMQYECEFIKNM